MKTNTKTKRRINLVACVRMCLYVCGQAGSLSGKLFTEEPSSLFGRQACHEVAWETC